MFAVPGGHTSPCSSEPRCHTDTTAGQSLLLSVMQTAHALPLTEFTAPTHVTEQYSLAQPTFLTQRHHHQPELGFTGQCCSRPEPAQTTDPSHYMLRFVPRHRLLRKSTSIHLPKGGAFGEGASGIPHSGWLNLFHVPAGISTEPPMPEVRPQAAVSASVFEEDVNRELDNPSAVSIGWTLPWG